ncbi:MAG: hypothetical protein LUP97_04185 [Methanoregula sp.]|nr:hypothetical protein [Methanoregula sp.]
MRDVRSAVNGSTSRPCYEYCNNYYRGARRLPFNHDCKNIDQWKKRPAELRSGKRT